jgi:hypothetical protein
MIFDGEWEKNVIKLGIFFPKSITFFTQTILRVYKMIQR